MNQLRATDVRTRVRSRQPGFSNETIVAVTLILVLTVSSLTVSQVLARTTFSSGFETGDTSEWPTVAGTPLVNTTYRRTGVYGAQFKCDSMLDTLEYVYLDAEDENFTAQAFVNFQNTVGYYAAVVAVSFSASFSQYNGDLYARWEGGYYNVSKITTSTWMNLSFSWDESTLDWILDGAVVHSENVSIMDVYLLVGIQLGNPSTTFEVWADDIKFNYTPPPTPLTITLTADWPSVQAGKGITITIAIVAGAVEVHNYIINVTRDGALIRNNFTGSYFVETGESRTSVYTISGAKDLTSGTTTFTANSLTLSWGDPASEAVGPSSPSEGSVPAPGFSFPTSIGGFKLPKIVIPPFGIYGILLSLILIAVGGILASRKRATSGPRRAPRGPQYAGRKERRRETRRTRER